MKVGDLVKVSKGHVGIVLKVFSGDPCVYVRLLKTKKEAWLNKSALELLL